MCTDQSVLGRTFYLMGFVDGWSPMATRRLWPAPFDTDLEARRGLAFQLVEGIALLGNVDWQAKGLQDLGRPEGFHERQVDRWTAFLERIKGRELPGLRRGGRVAAGAPADRLHPRPHARRLPVRQRHVQARRAGAAGRHRGLGDGHRGRPEARPGLGRAVVARGHHGRRGPGGRLRRHDRHAARGTRSWPTTPRRRAARSTTSTTTACWPSGSWPSCWSRATSGPATTRSSRRSAPVVLDLMQAAAELAESTDYAAA